MKYKGIKNVNSSFNKTVTVKRKSLHFFACIVLGLIVCSCYNIAFIGEFKLTKFITQITSNWTPKPDDFGKIKFVNFSFNNDKNGDGIFIVSSPFKSYYVTNISDTILEVNGLGDVVVLSPIDGTVQDICVRGEKCDITLCNSNVLVLLQEVDYACISIGKIVSAGDKIAVSLNSKIRFSIVCSGEYISLPAGGVNDTFFE